MCVRAPIFLIFKHIFLLCNVSIIFLLLLKNYLRILKTLTETLFSNSFSAIGRFLRLSIHHWILGKPLILLVKTGFMKRFQNHERLLVIIFRINIAAVGLCRGLLKVSKNLVFNFFHKKSLKTILPYMYGKYYKVMGLKGKYKFRDTMPLKREGTKRY